MCIRDSYWDQMPGKSKAYYRKYCETEDYHKFAVIRTDVSKVVLLSLIHI